jgi:hypothetical protein
VRNYDLEFLKKFSMVIGFLVLVTVGLMVGAFLIHKQLPGEVNPDVAKRQLQRISPSARSMPAPPAPPRSRPLRPPPRPRPPRKSPTAAPPTAR